VTKKRKTRSGGKKRKKRLKRKVKASHEKKTGVNLKEVPELEDHTLILCGLHAECRKLSDLIGIMAKGYSECEE
jgi:hypothetical protein